MAASRRAPFVSCIMPTRNRRAFLEQALRCFLRQTHQSSELIVVDDSDVPVRDLCTGLARVRYIRLSEHTPTGTKLNIGIETARGAIVQKLDDDDYYGPAFLETAVTRLGRRRAAIVTWDCFLILIAGEKHLRFSGHGWTVGGTMCFHRGLWKQTRFRDIPSAVDHYFFIDSQAEVVGVCAPESYVVVRHGRHTWTRMSDGESADAYLGSLPIYKKPITKVIDPRDVDFYLNLPLTTARSGRACRA